MNLLRSRFEFVLIFRAALVIIFFLFLIGIAIGVLGIFPNVVGMPANYIFLGVGFGFAFLCLIAFLVNLFSLKQAKKYFRERVTYFPKKKVILSIISCSVLIFTIPFAVYLGYFYKNSDEIVRRRFPNETDTILYKRTRPDIKVIENETKYVVDNYPSSKSERKARDKSFRKGNINSIMDNKDI